MVLNFEFEDHIENLFALIYFIVLANFSVFTSFFITQIIKKIYIFLYKTSLISLIIMLLQFGVF
jgi:hypothetical protein